MRKEDGGRGRWHTIRSHGKKDEGETTIRPQGNLWDKVDCAKLETFLDHLIKMTNIILVSSSWHLSLSLSLSLSFTHMHYASLRFSFLWSMRVQGGNGIWFHFLFILQPLSICLFVFSPLYVSLRFLCFWSMMAWGGGGVWL